MPRILHISCDFPDQIESHKTHAVRNLVRHASGFEHHVVSLNRTVRPDREQLLDGVPGMHAVSFFAPPYGVFLRSSMSRLARRLAPVVSAVDPDLIHCHKLTFEGIVGLQLSRRFGVPLVCTIRGDTDLKVIRFKPTYARLFRNIVAHSKRIFFVAPWTRHKVESWLEESLESRATLLPNIVEVPLDGPVPAPTISTTFVTVCHLKDYRRKNLTRVIRALDLCVRDGHDVRLDIVGGGPVESVARASREISRTRHPDRIRLLGNIDRSTLMNRLQDYAGLVLPSYPETFGMVYLEALQAGIPFLHSRDAGVDGYFKGQGVSVAVDPGSVESIKCGITDLLGQQRKYKDNIRALASSGGLRRFDAASIALEYESTVKRIL